MKAPRAIFAGGGTGGHLFPALAIADKLKAAAMPEYSDNILFIGTRRGLEYRIRDKLGYPLSLINIRGIDRSLALSNIIFPFLLIGSILKSILIISRFKPDVVIGTGGYVMGPVILAAVLLGIPRVIQEQNSYPGLTTRKLSPYVDKVFLGFTAAAKYMKSGCTIIETGNPVKNSVGKVPRDKALEYFGLSAAKKTILILGGSQGAAKINQNIMHGLEKLPENVQLIWQTGERDYKEVAAFAGGRVSGRALFPFSDKLETAYAAADIVIARAGALTLAEIEAAGLPAILVPYPFATGNHQMVNARTFADREAAVIIENSRLDDTSLIEEAVHLIESNRINQMAEAVAAMKASRKQPAVDIIVDEIMELISLKKR